VPQPGETLAADGMDTVPGGKVHVLFLSFYYALNTKGYANDTVTNSTKDVQHFLYKLFVA
jgi:hypothetical protein